MQIPMPDPPFRKVEGNLRDLFGAILDRRALFDALNALALLDAARSDTTLTELALAWRRSGRAAPDRPRLSLREFFERYAARFAPEQTCSRALARSLGNLLCRALGPDLPMETLCAEDVAAVLARYKTPRSFNGMARRIGCALRWGGREGLCDPRLAEGVPKRIDWPEPAFLRPDRVERILRIAEAHPGAAESGVGAFLALSFFAGVRTAEIWRARWEDVDLEGAVLRIPQPKGFTRGRKPRLVELEPNAVAWLRLWRDWTAAHAGRAAGRIVRDEHDIRNWKAKRLVPEGLSWGNGEAHNAGRHTYATMHVAAFRNAAATAINLGHIRGTDLLDRHYRGLAPQALAESYWRILPSRVPSAPEPLPGRGFRSDLHGKRG